ncbi:hypothetical protein [Desulfobacter vibrioformis]|uniref:hypothetical protein n=1 Tax=Desulfobacter vibrioformis TaxID=34031 RepID=UPI000556A11F|nr:hypothetical protein [Desulfobacter vibrioformis]
MASVYFNRPPIEVGPNGSVSSDNPVPVASTSIFTVQPTNIAANYQVQYGSTFFSKPIPSGTPIPYPISKKWDNNAVTIKNLSQASEGNIFVGYFGMPEVVTDPVSSAKLGQYQLCSIKTKTSPMTLSLTNRTSNSLLVAVIQGGSQPNFIALNTPSDNLPPVYQDVPNFSNVSGNTWDVTYNWYGATLTIINLCLTTVGDTIVEVHTA